MAQVAPGSEMRARVDAYLEYLLKEWGGIPKLATEWGEWDEHDRLDFVVEWPIREDRLTQLQAWAQQGLLTPAQRARFEELRALVARYRPALQRVLAD